MKAIFIFSQPCSQQEQNFLLKQYMSSVDLPHQVVIINGHFAPMFTPDMAYEVKGTILCLLKYSESTGPFRERNIYFGSKADLQLLTACLHPLALGESEFVDCFSPWVRFHPVPTKEDLTLANKLVKAIASPVVVEWSDRLTFGTSVATATQSLNKSYKEELLADRYLESKNNKQKVYIKRGDDISDSLGNFVQFYKIAEIQRVETSKQISALMDEVKKYSIVLVPKESLKIELNTLLTQNDDNFADKVKACKQWARQQNPRVSSQTCITKGLSLRQNKIYLELEQGQEILLAIGCESYGNIAVPKSIKLLQSEICEMYSRVEFKRISPKV
jgi:hypothetical protein